MLSAIDRALRRPGGGGVRWLVLILPVLVLLVLFFLVPLGELLRMSIVAERPTPRNPDPAFTLGHYLEAITDGLYLSMMLNSLLVGVFTVLGTLAVGYPVAYYLTRSSGWERTLISVACLLPIFVNLIVGILGWYILILPFGVIQQGLSALGLIDGPLQLLRTFSALILVLVYEHLPFAVLILASSLQNLPADKINAARILGASNWRILRTLVLPLTMPGIVATTILVFALSVSSYLIPILIGGQRVPVLPLAIFSYGTELLNWPVASSLAFVLLVVVAGVTYSFTVITNRLTNRGKWEMV